MLMLLCACWMFKGNLLFIIFKGWIHVNLVAQFNTQLMQVWDPWLQSFTHLWHVKHIYWYLKKYKWTFLLHTHIKCSQFSLQMFKFFKIVSFDGSSAFPVFFAGYIQATNSKPRKYKPPTEHLCIYCMTFARNSKQNCIFLFSFDYMVNMHVKQKHC